MMHASRHTDLPDNPPDSQASIFPTKVTTNDSHASTPSSLLSNPISTTRSLVPEFGLPKIDRSTKSLPDRLPPPGGPRPPLDPFVASLYREMSIKNQLLKQDLVNAKEEYEHRESLLNKKIASMEHENKALHKINDYMYNTAESNSSL